MGRRVSRGKSAAFTCGVTAGPRVMGRLGKRLVLMRKSVSGGIRPKGAVHIIGTLVHTGGHFSVLVLPKRHRNFNSVSRCFC